MTDTVSMEGNPIRAFRKQHGLTLEALALTVGVRRAAVSKWENGVRPSPDMAIAVERATAGVVPRWRLRPDLWPEPLHAAGTLAETEAAE